MEYSKHRQRMSLLPCGKTITIRVVVAAGSDYKLLQGREEAVA